jgi:hypothetical protein
MIFRDKNREFFGKNTNSGNDFLADFFALFVYCTLFYARNEELKLKISVENYNFYEYFCGNS